MNVKMRQEVERKIASRLVKDILKAGYTILIDNGGAPEECTGPFGKYRQVMAEMFLADWDRLYLYRPGKDAKEGHYGWVFLVYGNDGYDVISDYTCNLRKLLAGAEGVADRYA